LPRWLACEFDGHRWYNASHEKYNAAAEKLLEVLEGKREVEETSTGCMVCHPESHLRTHDVKDPAEYVRLLENLIEDYDEIGFEFVETSDERSFMVRQAYEALCGYREKRFGTARGRLTGRRGVL